MLSLFLKESLRMSCMGIASWMRFRVFFEF